MSDNKNQTDDGDKINDPLTRRDVDAPQKDWQTEGKPEEEKPS